ncbi:MAG TPA: LytTR family transcriptional regulator DNA-binding domain-containing protein [Saprospiraceae bacterium]|nr:LytTR family transcriptional regulator DNA-binding domain-containing protein [Saprospiraceae bacterium]
MKKLNILIVEDEVLIAETIRLYLMDYNHTVAAICISYEEAIEAYHLHLPDLVLLDIRLYGEKSGIDVANYLNKQINKPPYIFLTSQYDKRTLDAAVQTVPYGYITKPFSKETLMASIEAAYRLFESQKVFDQKIEVFDGKNNHLLLNGDIVYLMAEHVYTKFVLKSGATILCRMTLQSSCETIKSNHFFQCHRSFIINLTHIANWNKEEIVMSNGDSIPVSRSRKEELSNLMNKEKSSQTILH